MKKKLLLFGVIFCQVTLILRAQNIQQTAPVVLPLNPSTSYVVGSGENRTISSASSITLLPGTHLQQGSIVNLKIQNQPLPPVPSNPNANLSMNWVASKTYDLDGNVIAEDKNFFDDAGKPLQSQVKNLSKGHVLAQEPLVDAQERETGSTLAAPTNNSTFSYKEKFVTNAAGNKYTYQNFDLLKTNQPDPVGNSNEGTLGWYYSNNNSLESHIATTAYPYSRAIYNTDGTNSIKQIADTGDELRMGKGREVSSNQVTVTNELDFYTSIRDKFFSTATVGEKNALTGKALIEVLTDANKNSSLEILDLSGKTLMSARPDINGPLTLQHQTILNAVKKEYVDTVFLGKITLNSMDPNQPSQLVGAMRFSVSSKYGIIVFENGVQIYSGIGNGFEMTWSGDPVTLGDFSSLKNYRIVSDFPFSITDDDGCESCPGRIAESNNSSIRYFNLLQPTTVSITGDYELYDMSTETVVNAGTLPAGYYKLVALLGDVTLSYNTKVSDVSYVFYNQLGQTLAAIAPKGVNALITNGINSYATLNDIPFVSTNSYDLQGRLVATKSTDAGLTEFIYRKDGAVRFSQNVEQKKNDRFSYVNYDRWGRTVEAGEYTPDTAGDITFVAAKTNDVLLETVSQDGGLTIGTKQYVTRNHYDLPNQSHGLNNYVQDEAFLRGAISWTENASSKTWFNYDDQGRMIWTVKEIAGLGLKTIGYTYNSASLVQMVDYQKESINERFVHHYEYNADLNLETVYTSKDGITKKKQASYDYYLHGPLKRVELGDELQGIDYVYASNGMLKSINHPQQSLDPGRDGMGNNFASDAFGMTLEYFNGDYTRANTGIGSMTTNTNKTWYNGNISGQVWRSKKPDAVTAVHGSSVNDAQMFTYEYNDKEQFNNNKFGKPDFATNNFIETASVNKEHGLTYDANGNIKTLKRNNQQGTQKELNYNYQSNTNKLNSVDDYATYTYDDLGQMIAQERENGQKFFVTYEPNGKILAIYADANHTQLRVSYAYDENGMRIRKTDHLQNVSTYYVHDDGGSLLAIYDNNATALQQKEVLVYGADRLGIYTRLDDKYQYELKDHLGNVRVVISQDKDANGNANVLYSADYYPFGSQMSLANYEYRYGYQGQYAEIDPETGWNNFELRTYDPAIGRWMSIDPYGQYWSPYLGMGNNPVSAVDPDGGYSSNDPIDPPVKFDPKTGQGYGQLKEVTITGKSRSAYQTIGLAVYKMSGAGKFDDDMRQARSEGASLGEAGMQAFFLNKQNEMMMGNGSASMYARTSRIFAAKGVTANPFKGKTFSQIDEMFKAKGFTTKGVDPLTGKGSYFSPSGTRYYLDKGGMYKKGFEGPHVDIWYNGHPSFEKVKFFLDGSPKMYTPLK